MKHSESISGPFHNTPARGTACRSVAGKAFFASGVAMTMGVLACLIIALEGERIMDFLGDWTVE